MNLEYMICLKFCTATMIVYVCLGIHKVVLLMLFLAVIIVESFRESQERRPASYLCVGQQWSAYWTGRGNQAPV